VNKIVGYSGYPTKRLASVTNAGRKIPSAAVALGIVRPGRRDRVDLGRRAQSLELPDLVVARHPEVLERESVTEARELVLQALQRIDGRASSPIECTKICWPSHHHGLIAPYNCAGGVIQIPSVPST